MLDLSLGCCMQICSDRR
uniref:Uncharacterized protein n=1 Tax=Rhizophora mucronata TaxID=61149 RepID=A0A2P2LLP5_RHIMU